MATRTDTAPKFQESDRVRLLWGTRMVMGTVLEDRGLIGAYGRRLFLVSVPQDPEEPMVLEVQEDELQRDDDPLPTKLDKRAVTKYLSDGGLLLILASNLPGGPRHPRVWLCLNQLGNITHTFVAERGVIGGATVPFNSLQGAERIFTPKLNEVVEFLASFGLSAEDIRQIIAKVRTAP